MVPGLIQGGSSLLFLEILLCDCVGVYSWNSVDLEWYSHSVVSLYLHEVLLDSYAGCSAVMYVELFSRCFV